MAILYFIPVIALAILTIAVFIHGTGRTPAHRASWYGIDGFDLAVKLRRRWYYLYVTFTFWQDVMGEDKTRLIHIGRSQYKVNR